MTSRANKKKIKKKRAGPAQIVHPWFIILGLGLRTESSAKAKERDSARPAHIAGHTFLQPRGTNDTFVAYEKINHHFIKLRKHNKLNPKKL